MIADDSYSLAPSLLIVADDSSDHHAAAMLARSIGGRLRDVIGLGDGIAWLDANAPVDTVLVTITHDQGAALDRLLDRLDADAHAGRNAVVVTMPAALIDIVAARVAHDAITLLADPAPGELVAAVALTLARTVTPSTLNEEPSESGRLRQLSEEVGRIARTLAELSGGGVQAPRAGYRGPPPADIVDEAGFELSAAHIRTAIRTRRLRDQFFDSRLFADPAWDMLLDLAAARLEGRRVAVSSLCIAAAVPATTALRWIKTLVDEGMFVRVADPRDGRRVFIDLSDTALQGVRSYFRAVGRAGVELG